MSSTVQVTDNTPLLFKALAWDNYYRTQFPDSPGERPEFNSIIYDKSSAEFKALLFDGGGGVCLENVMDNKYSELVTDYNNNKPVEPVTRMTTLHFCSRLLLGKRITGLNFPTAPMNVQSSIL